MAMLSGLQGVRAAVCSQVGSHLSISTASRIKTGIHLDSLLADLGIKSLSLYTDSHADLDQPPVRPGLTALSHPA